MDLNLGAEYNGVTAIPVVKSGAGPTHGICLRSADPYQIPVDVRSDKRPFVDGSFLSDAYLSGRPINLHGECWGYDQADVDDLVDDWMAAFSPRSPSLYVSAPLKFYRRTRDTANWPDGKIPMFLTASPVAEPRRSPDSRRDSGGSVVIDVFATLYAPDPYAYIDAARIQATLTTASAALPYRGNAPAAPELWITLSSTPGPSSVTVEIDSATGRHDLGYSLLTIDTSGLSASATYVVSFADGVCRYGSVLTGVIASSAILGRIGPGATAKYTVNTGVGSRISSLKLVYPEAFF